MDIYTRISALLLLSMSHFGYIQAYDDVAFNKWLGDVVHQAKNSDNSVDTAHSVNLPSNEQNYQHAPGVNVLNSKYKAVDYPQQTTQHLQPEQQVPQQNYPQQQLLGEQSAKQQYPQQPLSGEQLVQQQYPQQQYPQQQYPHQPLSELLEQQQYPQQQYPQQPLSGEQLEQQQYPQRQYSQQPLPEQLDQQQYQEQHLAGQVTQEYSPQIPSQQVSEEYSEQSGFTGSQYPAQLVSNEPYRDQSGLSSHSSEKNYPAPEQGQLPIHYPSNEELQKPFASSIIENSHEQQLPEKEFYNKVYSSLFADKPAIKSSSSDSSLQGEESEDSGRSPVHSVNEQQESALSQVGVGLKESQTYAIQQGHPGFQVPTQDLYPNQLPQQVGNSHRQLLPGQQQGYPEQIPHQAQVAPEQQIHLNHNLDQVPAQLGAGDQQPLPQQQGTPELRLSQQHQLFPSDQIQQYYPNQVPAENKYFTGQRVTSDTAMEATSEPLEVTTGSEKQLSLGQQLSQPLAEHPGQDEVPERSDLLVHGAPQAIPQDSRYGYEVPETGGQINQIAPGPSQHSVLPPSTQLSLPNKYPSIPSQTANQPTNHLPYQAPSQLSNQISNQYPSQVLPQQPYDDSLKENVQSDNIKQEPGVQPSTEGRTEQPTTTGASLFSKLSNFIYPQHNVPQEDVYGEQKSAEGEQSFNNSDSLPSQAENITDINAHHPSIQVNLTQPAPQQPTVLSSPALSSTKEGLNFRYPDVTGEGPEVSEQPGVAGLQSGLPNTAPTEGAYHTEDGALARGPNMDSKQWLKEYDEDDQLKKNETSGQYDTGYGRYDDDSEDDGSYYDENDKGPSVGGDSALTNFRHEPVRLRQYNENNMSLIVLYTWLGVVSFMVIIAFVIVKHRQKIYTSLRSWRNGEITDTMEKEALIA